MEQQDIPAILTLGKVEIGKLAQIVIPKSSETGEQENITYPLQAFICGLEMVKPGELLFCEKATACLHFLYGIKGERIGVHPFYIPSDSLRQRSLGGTTYGTISLRVPEFHANVAFRAELAELSVDGQADIDRGLCPKHWLSLF